MKSFTDNELRVLKGMIKSADWPISSRRLGPLLARLEAAEKAAAWIENLGDWDLFQEPYDDWKAWQKSRGFFIEGYLAKGEGG